MELQDVKDGLKTVDIRGRQGFPLADRRDHRGSAQRAHDHPGRRRGPRERGRPRRLRADGDARRHQLHGQARPRPRLPVADGPARGAAAARVHGAPERGAQPHGLHRLHRGARGHRHRHLRPRPRPHHRHGHRPHQGLHRHRLAGPRLPADRARGRRAGARGPYRGQRRPCASGRPLPGRRHLRDHERRRHHGAHARPRRLRPAPRAQDRHHRGPDRLPPAPRQDRQGGGEDDGRQRAWRQLRAARVRDRGGAGRAPGVRQGRPQRPGPRAGARACRQRADRPAGRRRRRARATR